MTATQLTAQQENQRACTPSMVNRSQPIGTRNKTQCAGPRPEPAALALRSLLPRTRKSERKLCRRDGDYVSLIMVRFCSSVLCLAWDNPIGRKRLPAGDRADMFPRFGIVGDAGKAPAQFNGSSSKSRARWRGLQRLRLRSRETSRQDGDACDGGQAGQATRLTANGSAVEILHPLAADPAPKLGLTPRVKLMVSSAPR
jgi:hypothetical protein